MVDCLKTRQFFFNLARVWDILNRIYDDEEEGFTGWVPRIGLYVHINLLGLSFPSSSLANPFQLDQKWNCLAAKVRKLMSTGP